MTQDVLLVTGGAGFIGSHLVDGLARSGRRVRVLDNFSTGLRVNLARFQSNVELLHGDLCDSDLVRTAMSEVETVFHLAAISSVQQSFSDPLASLDVNVRGTMQILEAARQGGVRRVVIASSAAVYGDSAALPVTERATPDPLSPYAIHKLACEEFCRVYTQTYGLETVALRYFNVYGTRQRPDSDYAAVVPRFVDVLSRNAAPLIYGDGEQTRDFIHVSDIVRANMLAAGSPEANGQVINVASGSPISVNALAQTLIELTGATVTPQYMSPKPGDIRESVADISLARRLLGFEPQVTLREGLAELVNERHIAAKLADDMN